MRDHFAKTLTELSLINPDLYLIYGDIGNRLFDDFKAKNNNHYILLVIFYRLINS